MFLQRTSNGVDAMKNLKTMNVAKMAAAIEADAGQPLAGLREALAEAKAGVMGHIHTPDQIAARQRGRPAGTKAAVTKEPVTLRLDPDVLTLWRASGKGWQTRAAAALATMAPARKPKA
ncbi:MAG: BrnA antitoxin family protein [Chryseolinea sp.]